MIAEAQYIGDLNVVLIAAGIALVLSGGLAALLVLAERYLVNYGECVIDVNRGSRRLEVKGGGSLLNTLKDNSIFLPSACGGKGTCAMCKCKVLGGAPPM